MQTVKNNGLDPNLYQQPEKVKTVTEQGQKLNQEDFFKIMNEQLANQDPTKPVDNSQMVAQMTSFSIAEGITDLNKKFDTFSTSMTSNQALQASSLIGQKVLMTGNTGYRAKETDNMSGVVIAEKDISNLVISIEKKNGEVVKTIDVGSQKAGNIEFNWDGKDAKGNLLPPGEYVAKAQGSVLGKSTTLPTAIHRQVNSVSLASQNQGIVLNLNGNTSAKLTDVLQIGG